MPDTTEQLIAGLRIWTKDHDPFVKAAVELLIWRGWLRRGDFVRACVRQEAGPAAEWSSGTAREAWIDWPQARKFADAASTASTSEMAILDLAIELGRDRFRFYIMGTAHSKAVAAAVAMAVGEPYDPQALDREGDPRRSNR